MPTLTITRLECFKKRDPIDKDEIDIYVSVDDGAEDHLSGPHFLDKSRNDRVVDLNESEFFHDKIRIRLRERNGDRGGNNDLDLGTKNVFDSERGAEPNTVPFTANTGGVLYTLTYEVT